MTNKVEELIIRARIRLLINCPFFGQLALRLMLVDATNWIPTMATDGKHFYYNRNFVLLLNRNELEFCVGHEVLHCVYDHVGVFSRRGYRIPKLWNYAGDFVINRDLKEQKIGEAPKLRILYDSRFDENTAEEVYDILYKSNEKKRKELVGDGGFDVHLPDGNEGPTDGEPAGMDDLPTLLDDDDLKKLSKKPDPTGKDGPIPLSDEEKENIDSDWKSAARNAAESCEAGDVPGNIKRLLNELTNPVMHWRELLNTQIKSLVKYDYSWQRRSRKSIGMSYYLPGTRNEDTIDIAVCIDTSGSISDVMLKDFVSEVKGIMEEFESFVLKLWFFDTKTYTKYEFNESNVDEITNVEIEGGGGTSFMCNWDYLKSEGLTPAQFIMFTDGYPYGPWGDPTYCDTLFVIHGNPDIRPPFGLSAYYNRQEELMN